MNKTFITIFILAAAVLLYLLAPILTPFLVGILLAYLVDPLVRKLMHLHLPRILAVAIVFLVLFLIILLLIVLLVPLIQTQIIALIEFIPEIVSFLQNTILPWVKDHFGFEEIINVTTLKATLADNLGKAGGMAGWLVKTIVHSGFEIVGVITKLVLIPVVTFYLLRDWDKVIKGVRNLLPRRIEPVVVKLAVQCNDVLSAFFRGQLLVMLSLGIIYSVGLMLVGVRIGLMIGLMAGAAAIVPYLGFILGVTTASIAAFVQFGSMVPVFWVWVVFAIGQTLESTVLTPKLVGHRIGLHPVAVIFSVLAGGLLCGFFGVLLALPVAAVIMVLLRFLNQRYRKSELYR